MAAAQDEGTWDEGDKGPGINDKAADGAFAGNRKKSFFWHRNVIKSNGRGL